MIFTRTLTAALTRLEDNVAAVGMEPMRSEAPENDFVAKVAARCREAGAVFVVDEVTSGLRYGFPGAMARLGVEPDLKLLAPSPHHGGRLTDKIRVEVTPDRSQLRPLDGPRTMERGISGQHRRIPAVGFGLIRQTAMRRNPKIYAVNSGIQHCLHPIQPERPHFRVGFAGGPRQIFVPACSQPDEASDGSPAEQGLTGKSVFTRKRLPGVLSRSLPWRIERDRQVTIALVKLQAIGAKIARLYLGSPIVQALDASGARIAYARAAGGCR